MQVRLAILLLILLLAAPQAHGAVSLEASLGTGQASLSAKVSSDSSMAECQISLYASSDRNLIRRRPTSATRLFTGAGSALPTSLQANNLPRVRRDRNRTERVYLRARKVCGRSGELSNTVSVGLTTLRRGQSATFGVVRNVPRWFRAVKSRFSAAAVPQLTQVFSELEFQQPVDLQHAGDGTNRLFLVEKTGKIWVFQNNDNVSSAALFLDISSKVINSGERGLLGLAFHPSYETNGQFFVHYSSSASGNPAVISRFVVDPSDANSADENSEVVILTEPDPFSNHNGGQLAFGPDGFLYISLGDGGSGGDPLGSGQSRTTILGKILRIDINQTAGGNNYAIPPTNPYAVNTQGFREEIFAYGLRNTWRFSFDSANGWLYAADVGQGRIEEIDIIVSGGNYGWNRMEGSDCYPQSSNCDRTGLILPIYEYDHTLGASITGGYVYRGTRSPAMQGMYVYGDYLSGRIWGLFYNGSTARNVDLVDTDMYISSFGVDEAGEVYVLSYTDGKIYTLR